MKKTTFARIGSSIELPQLLEMQTRSYEEQRSGQRDLRHQTG